MGSRKPLVGVSCCRRLADFPFHRVGEKYIAAVTDLAGAIPVLIPALGDRIEAADLLARLDGLFLTGSSSNVEPHRYGGPASAPGTFHDPDRDATTLPLIQMAAALDVPTLGICRGLQEMNVALGGTLHQKLHELPGRVDHRAEEQLGPQEQYRQRQTMRLVAGGWFADWAGSPAIEVNSLHEQGVDRLAPGLAVEAVADDGQIEAFRREGAAFCIGVQWHPEFRAGEDPFSTTLFQRFGRAMRERVGRARAVA